MELTYKPRKEKLPLTSLKNRRQLIDVHTQPLSHPLKRLLLAAATFPLDGDNLTLGIHRHCRIVEVL